MKKIATVTAARLTRRGRIVAYGLPIIAAFVVGILTADWCWYGYCGA